jgi:hypothetical protein
MNHRILIFLFFLIIPSGILSQSVTELGFLPSLNINKKLPRDWSVNFKTESRQSLYKKDFDYNYVLTDVSLIVAKRIGVNTSIAAGYLMRIDDNSIISRSIQQLSLVKRYSGFALSHRFSADQTFKHEEGIDFRFRYRVSSEIPLEGHALDPKEFFVKLSNEYLASFHLQEFDLEIRGAGFIGYALSPSSKLELGIDFRTDSFLNDDPRKRFWIGFNIYQTF